MPQPAAPGAGSTRPTSTSGLVLRAQQRYEEAASCFEQALELDPKCDTARKALRDVRETVRFLKKKGQNPPAPTIGTLEGARAGCRRW